MKSPAACSKRLYIHMNHPSILMQQVVVIVILLSFLNIVPSSSNSAKIIHYAHYSFIIGNTWEEYLSATVGEVNYSPLLAVALIHT